MTATAKIWAAYAVETDVHSGDFVEVLELQVQDYGGNVLWSGKAGHEPKYQVPVKLVATKVGLPAEGGEVLCSYHD